MEMYHPLILFFYTPAEIDKFLWKSFPGVIYKTNYNSDAA